MIISKEWQRRQLQELIRQAVPMVNKISEG
jgi:hypothetical protein